MPSPRCSIATTAARSGRMDPEPVDGGRENLEAVEFLQAPQQPSSASAARHACTVAEESTAWPRRDPPAGGRRPGLLASNGTWAGCTTRCTTSQHDPVYRKYHHDDMTFGIDLRLLRELHPADLPRRSGARQRLAARQDAGRPLAEAWPTSAPITASCGAHPGKKLLFMGCEIGQETRMEPRRLASSGTCSTARPMPGCSA